MRLVSVRITAFALLAAHVLAGCSRPSAAWIPLATQDAVELSELPALLGDFPIVIVGEHHGLVEPVDTVKSLLAESSGERSFTHLALEWPISDRRAIDRYLAGDDQVLERIERRNAHLPGVTIEFCSLFSFVREYNREHADGALEIILIDVPRPVRGTAEEARDQHMLAEIERVLTSRTDARILVHVGSDHAVKRGLLAYPSQTKGTVAMEPLGAMTCARHPGQVATVKVLAPVDPMWKELDRAQLFGRPVAVRLTSQWPESRVLLFYSSWRPDNANESPKAGEVFDYAVWWPESRNGTRAK